MADMPPIPPIPDVYENDDASCFKTWLYPPLPKGFSFPMDLLQFCTRWENELTRQIKEYVDKYGDDGEADTDSVSWREAHKETHDNRETRDALRTGIDLMLKHNVGTIDLSDSLWQTLNQHVGFVFWNLRRLKSEQESEVRVTVMPPIKLDGSADGLRDVLAGLNGGPDSMPDIVAVALLKSIRENMPEVFAKTVEQLEDPNSDVPDHVRVAWDRIKNRGLL